MASFADALSLFTGTELFKVVVPFFLIYTVIYAILKRVKFIESRELNASIAFIIALGVVLSPTARTFISAVVPPLASFGVVIFLLILVMFSSGMKLEDVTTLVQVSGTKVGSPERSMIWAGLIGVSLILIVAAVAGSFPDAVAGNIDAIQANATAMNMTVNDYLNTLSVGSRVMFFISLPQVMGLIVLVLIFVFAGIFLAI